ncbi:hypothetical protein FJTKL_14839 [Diaporthe vaccinii]|uniref:ATP phosphoribosyltransferase n=1 Tax=Diaporthe vaccinii TaxID=105482 RepID=A0ABR4F881_9PEZI
MSSSRTQAGPSPGEGSSAKWTTIYQLVMTPIIFVSFLVSLAWVDFRYSIMRSHSHSEEPSRLPRWLHRITYREAPYKYVKVDATHTTAPAESSEGTRWYYHSKQRKLMKMEADDAFQIRGTVLVALGLLAVAATWAASWAGWWLWTMARAKLG